MIVQQILPRAFDRGLLDFTVATVAMLALWSIIRWERKVGLAALESMSVDVLALTAELDTLLDERRDANPVASKDGVLVFRKTGRPAAVVNAETTLDPLLTQAQQEARELGHDYVASEHLVLALFELADADLLKLFDKHRINYEAVKRAVLDIYAGPTA